MKQVLGALSPYNAREYTLDGDAPTLVDGQIIRLPGESFPLTAVSAVAVVSHKRTLGAILATSLGATALWLGQVEYSIQHNPAGYLVFAAALLTLAYRLWIPHYFLRINLNSGQLIDLRCPNSTSAFAGRAELETALAQRVQPVVRG